MMECRMHHLYPYHQIPWLNVQDCFAHRQPIRSLGAGYDFTIFVHDIKKDPPQSRGSFFIIYLTRLFLFRRVSSSSSCSGSFMSGISHMAGGINWCGHSGCISCSGCSSCSGVSSRFIFAAVVTSYQGACNGKHY